MKKSSFVAMVLGTVSAVLFALGMCMALIPEWDAFQAGHYFRMRWPAARTCYFNRMEENGA